jgi:hypothetical protein
MLETILIIVAVIVVLFIVVVAMQPSDFRITRSASMSAAPAKVFGEVNDFHHWPAWSPWEKFDPDMKRKHEGAPAGAGAIYSWEGNKKVGSGRMTIMESRPGNLVSIKLEFLKPFKATNTAEFTFKPEGNQTQVTWSMIGKKNFLMKAFSLFMNMDKMVGPDFERGLANMKAIVETTK